MRALVVFHDHGTHILAPLLKRGFRHVFAVRLNGQYWIRIDGMSGVPVAEVVAGADYDLAGFYLDEGYEVLEVEVGDKPPRSPLVFANCVGLSKGFLGIRRPFIVTPYGLYRYLRKVA